MKCIGDSCEISREPYWIMPKSYDIWRRSMKIIQYWFPGFQQYVQSNLLLWSSPESERAKDRHHRMSFYHSHRPTKNSVHIDVSYTRQVDFEMEKKTNLWIHPTEKKIKSSIALPKLNPAGNLEVSPDQGLREIVEEVFASAAGHGPAAWKKRLTGSKWPWNSRRISWIHKGCKIFDQNDPSET